MNPWRGLRNLPREMWILFTAVLINRSGTMALPFLALYLTQGRGFTTGDAGLAITFYGAGSMITSPLAGRLSDRLGPLRIMKAALLLSGALLLLFPLAKSFTMILTLAALWAIMSEAFRPASLTIITELVAPEQRRAAFALNRLAINLGMSIGPLVAGFLVLVSYPAIFVVDGVTSILAGIVLVVVPIRVRRQATKAAAESNAISDSPNEPANVLARRTFLQFLLGLLLVDLVFFQIEAAMPLYLVRDLRLSESTYGMMFTLNTLLIIFIEVPLNLAMERWPHNKALALGAFFFGAGFGAMTFATGVFSVGMTVVVWTFGEMIVFPGSAAYVAEVAPVARRGQYMGFYNMTFSLAFAIGPWLGAQILERLGATVLWSAAFMCGCLAAVIMRRLRTKNSLLE